MTARWALIRGDEDGNPITWLTDSELRGLLFSSHEWGVAEFSDLEGLPTDPNYWPDKLGVLIRFEVVIPERSGVYRLPSGIELPEPPDAWTVGREGPISLKDVVE